MIVKIVTLFLIGMAVLAMFGRLRLSERLRNRLRGRLGGARCPGCGAPRVGRGPCPCGRG